MYNTGSSSGLAEATQRTALRPWVGCDPCVQPALEPNLVLPAISTAGLLKNMKGNDLEL